MAIVNGSYQDKGRCLDIETSIMDVRVLDYAYDATYISLDPTNANFVDVGEWLVVSDESLSRPAAVSGTPVPSGGTGAVPIPRCVFADRGMMDVQSVGKIPVLLQGGVEGLFRLWACDVGIADGDELTVIWFTGNDPIFTTATGFTGIKGVLCPPTVTNFTNLGVPSGTYVAWIVGVAKEAAAAGTALRVELYSTPSRLSITVP